MIIGYLFETFLGFSFALGLEVIRSTPSTDPSPRLKQYRAVILRGCSVFYDCAIYFAASIQIACVVVLVRKDYGISAAGLGGLTVQITWAVGSAYCRCYILLLCLVFSSRTGLKRR